MKIGTEMTSLSTPADARSKPSLAIALPGSRLSIIGLAVWTVVVGTASALVAIHVDDAQLQRALVMRPPVVVLNTMDWIQHAGEGDTPAARYANGAAVMHATVDQLRAHGALVLDASALHSYPDVVRLDAPNAEKSK